jgi:hypothetical protein
MTVSNVTNIQSPTIHLRTKYIDAVGYIDRRKYQDGSLAVALITGKSQSDPGYIILSINLSEYDLTPEINSFYVRGNAEHQGLSKALVDTGLFKITNTAAANNAWFIEMQFV